MSYIHPSRPKERIGGDEEAGSDLRLGEFAGVPTLSTSEARMVINKIMETRRDQRPKGSDIGETETLIKTQDYLDIFARFKQKENIEAVERLLSRIPGLEPFERSQLASLCCDTADEAKTLIPSLSNKISDDELDDILRQMGQLISFIE